MPSGGYHRRPLDWVLSAPSNVAVLRALKDSRHGMSGRAVAREAGFNHRGVSRAIARLESLGILESQGSGKVRLVRLNSENLLVKEALLPLLDAERRVAASLRSTLRAGLSGAEAAVLFGSAARGETRPGSDVDLLIVAKAGSKERLRERVEGLSDAVSLRYGLRLSPIIKTLSELKARPRRAEPLLSNVMSEGVDLLDTRLRELLR